jgi:GNAT superfamily N-acetyltransferase
MTVQALVESIGSGTFLQAMDENLWAFWCDYGRGPGAELHEGPDLRWFASGVPLAVFNAVPQVQLLEDAVEPALARIQVVADRRRVPAMWWVGPNSRPANLGGQLERHGLSLARVMMGMAVNLETLDRVATLPADFHIERVHGSEMQRLWARVLGSGSGFGEEAARVLMDLEPTLLNEDYIRKPRYIGFLSDRPVATSALVPAAGVAGIYAVSTIPEARQRRIGAAMTIVPLLEARTQGYSVGILQATLMGHPVYQRLGFQDVCEYRCYSQSPTTGSQ